MSLKMPVTREYASSGTMLSESPTDTKVNPNGTPDNGAYVVGFVRRWSGSNSLNGSTYIDLAKVLEVAHATLSKLT